MPTVASDGRGEQDISVDQFVQSYDFSVPYGSNVPQEIHTSRGRRVYSWLLGNNLVSPGELKEIRARGLNAAEFKVIEFTPQDYWLIATARAMNQEQHERFLSRLSQGYFNLEDYRLQQSVWSWTAFSNHHNDTGNFPTREEEYEMVSGMSGQFRAYWVLKRDAFREEISYPWAKESWDRLLEMRKEREQKERAEQGMVTAWQL